MPREERPFNPPQRKPVSEYRTPSPAVVLFTEAVGRDDPAYYQNSPVKRGTLYSSIVGGNQTVTDTYPTLYFLREQKLGNSDQLVLWHWATVPDAEDTYNATIEYDAETVTAPQFTRVYTIRRDDYESAPTLAIGSILTALIGVTILDGGSGYTNATGTIDGTDVEIDFVISNGQIISGVITNEGSGVAAGNTIIISGDGTGAVAIPIVQGTNCFLRSQKKQELPDDDPLRNEFVRVIRIYITLPGPFTSTTRIDDDGIVVTINSRQNKSVNITSGETLIAGVWTKTTLKDEDDFVSTEVVETRAIPGNPMVKTSIDSAGDIMTETRTMSDFTTIATTNVISGGVWTKTFEEPISDKVAWKVVQVRNTQDPLDSFSVELPDLIPQVFRALVPTIEEESIVIGNASLPTLPTGFLFAKQAQIDAYTYRLSIRFRDVSVLPKTKGDFENTEKYGGGTLFVFMELESFAHVPAPLPDTGLLVESSSVTDLGNGLWFKETRQLYGALAWPAIVGTHVDERYGISVGITKQVVDAGTRGGVTGFDYTEVRPLDKWRSIQIVSSLDITSLPAPITWIGGQNHSFPPELINASYNFAEGSVGCCDSFSLSLIANINQYSGAVKARYTEQFYLGVPPDNVVVTQFFPTAHSFGFAWASACPPSSCKSGAPTFRIPPTLHPLINLTLGGLGIVNTLAATTPTALPHGAYIMLPPQVERWRFGVFRRFLTEVFVP